MILTSASPKLLHLNALTSFSMLRGLGCERPMTILKNASVSGFVLETVSGLRPSRLRRIRFFSSTEKRIPMRASRR